MSHTKPMAQALGKVAKSRIKKASVGKLTDRQAAERTYLALKKTLERNDRWFQSEARDVLKFRDTNGVDWYLSVINKKARLYLNLVSGGNSSNLGWLSEPLLVGWPIEKDGGHVGFALTVDFDTFARWRKSVQMKRPASRPSPKSN